MRVLFCRPGELGTFFLDARMESANVSIEERDGSISLTMEEDGSDAIALNDWAITRGGPGEEIVWRVKTIGKAYDTRTRTIGLEHIINSLKDSILFDEVGPAEMGGNSSGVSCRTAITYALGKQSKKFWELGGFAFSGSAYFEFNGETVYDAIETVTGTLEGAEWSYDFSRVPFRLTIGPRATSIGSEMRMSRNISTAKIDISKNGFYTRFFPIGKNDLRISGDYVSRNEGLYGTVDKVETNSGLDTEAKLRAWANERLRKHAEPQVTVSITGINLSAATGEPLDQLAIGRICRMPLPAYGTTITERITKLQWPDAVKEPTKINVTMANTPNDLAAIIKSEQSSSGSGSRTAAKNAGEDHAWFVDTEDHVAMVAEAVAGPGASKDWSRVSVLSVDGKGIHGRVTEAEGEIIKHESRIEANEEAIRLEVEDREKADEEYKGQIEVTARKVGLVVTETKDGDVINVAEICAEINAAGDSVAWINADKVWIGNKKKYADGVFDDYDVVISGKASIGELDAVKARVGTLETDYLKTSDLKSTIGAIGVLDVQTLNATSLRFWNGGSNYQSVREMVEGYKIVKSGDEYKLQYKRYYSTIWSDVPDSEHFNRADAQSYLGTWVGDDTTDSATYSVVASPSGATVAETGIQLFVNDYHAYIVADGTNVVSLLHNTGYDHGVTDGRSAAWALAYSSDISVIPVPPESGTPPASVTAKWPGDGIGTTRTFVYSVDVDNNFAYLKNAVGNAVARKANPAFGNGWTAARNKVSLPSGNTGSEWMTFKVPKSTVGASDPDEWKYKVSEDDTYCYIKNQAGTIVARCDNGAWYNGYDANDTAFIGDSGSNDVSGQTITIAPGGNTKLWPGYLTWAGAQQWPDANARVVTVSARIPRHSDYGHSGNPVTYAQGEYDTSGKTSLGSLSLSSVMRGHIAVRVTCAGSLEECYITIT